MQIIAEISDEYIKDTFYTEKLVQCCYTAVGNAAFN
jgi:hypothetical protein